MAGIFKSLLADCRQPDGNILALRFTSFPNDTTPQVLRVEFIDPRDNNKVIGEHYYSPHVTDAAMLHKPSVLKPEWWSPFTNATYQQLVAVAGKHDNKRAPAPSNEIGILLCNRAGQLVGSVSASVGTENNDAEAIKAFTTKFGGLALQPKDLHVAFTRYNPDKRNHTYYCHVALALEDLLDRQHGTDSDEKIATLQKLVTL